MKAEEVYPSLPLAEWEETKITLHLFCQIVGKIRLTLSPKLNHWWHAPLYLSARGLTTRTIPCGNQSFDLELDFVDHELLLRTSAGDVRRMPLRGVSVSRFYVALFEALQECGMRVTVLAKPFDPERVKSRELFATDETHATYDPDSVHRFWWILSHLEPIFCEFRGRFLGKCSPVHFFWHSFDLAVTRFSGRAVAVAADADPVTREAYSHEVISAGFWVGDDQVREPAFYAYAHPQPQGLTSQPLRPAAASWAPQGGMALLRYEDFRRAKDPRAALLDFLQSSYEAAAKLAEWPRAQLELPSS
ncbi:MAG: hypothetical protein JSW67_08490 [Candidatus Latescibacterota bacterium]|nr:MAG: hypothetical protein JSW67_08490 [Candidatus Latescibacterota bacterium]